MIRLFFIIKSITQKINDDKVSVYAAQSSFFILVSFIPCLILLCTLIQYTPITEQMLLNAFEQIVPSQLAPLVASIINEIYSRSSVAIISITAVATLWVAGKAFLGITEGLNSIYGITETRFYFLRRIKASFYTLVLLVIMVICLVLLVFGNVLLNLTQETFPVLNIIIGQLLRYKTILMQCLLTLFFMFLYKYIPNRKGSLIRELPGALFAGIGWQLFSFLYSLYVNYSSGFMNMYGSLATIVFAMLWLYFCISIVFYGAEINTFIEKKIIHLPKFHDKFY